MRHLILLRNLFQFLDLLKKYIFQGTETFVIIVDIVSLYTSFDQAMGIEFIKKSFLTNHSRIGEVMVQSIRVLLELVLKNIFFLFDGKIYRQVCGVAMGAKVAPAFANLFLSWWELSILTKLQGFKYISMYKRYTYDLFFYLEWING